MFFIIVTSVMTFLGLYVATRLIWPLPLPLWLRLLLSLVVLLLACKMTLLHRFLPREQILDVPDILLILLAWLHISVVLAALLTIVMDLLGLIPLLFGYAVHAPLARLAVAGVAGVLLAGLSVYNGLKPPQVVEVDVPVRNLPAELNGFRIGVLGDVHLGPLFREPWARTVADLTNEAAPDLIVTVGDIVDGRQEQMEDIVAPLADLRAPYGVYGVVGNHEYYSGLDAWRKHLPELGIRLLYNEHATITKNGATLVLAGLPDRVTLSRMLGEQPDLAKALKDSPQGDKVIYILLDHQPSGANDYAQHGIHAQFSGHTHGGVALPLQPLVARMNGGFVSGLYDVSGMSLLVTNGAGMWGGMPVRLGVPSQILIARLKPAAPAAEKK